MMRSIGLLGLAAIAILFSGCIAPAVVTGVDADFANIAAPGASGALRIPLDSVAIEEVAPPTITEIVAPRSSEVGPDFARIAAPAADEIVRFPLDSVSIEEVVPPTIAENVTPLSHVLHRVTRTIVAAQPAQPAATELGTLQRIKSVREISLVISPPQLADDQQLAIAMPRDFAAEALPLLAQQQPFTRGELADAGFEWHPAVNGLTFCYQPLYFEEVNLERYGRAHGILQPFVSAAAFYGRIPALPYMVFARPARRCTEHAHWTLPGYKIPQREPQPLVPSIHGAAAEVAVLYGIILLIP